MIMACAAMVTSCVAVRPETSTAKIAYAVERLQKKAHERPGVYSLQIHCEPHPEWLWMKYSSDDRRLIFEQPLSGEDVDNPSADDAFYVGAGLLPPDQIKRFEEVVLAHGLSTNRAVHIVGSSRYFSYEKDLSDFSPESIGRFVIDAFRRVYRRSPEGNLFYIIHRDEMPQQPDGEPTQEAAQSATP